MCWEADEAWLLTLSNEETVQVRSAARVARCFERHWKTHKRALSMSILHGVAPASFRLYERFRHGADAARLGEGAPARFQEVNERVCCVQFRKKWHGKFGRLKVRCHLTKDEGTTTASNESKYLVHRLETRENQPMAMFFTNP